MELQDQPHCQLTPAGRQIRASMSSCSRCLSMGNISADVMQTIRDRRLIVINTGQAFYLVGHSGLL